MSTLHKMKPRATEEDASPDETLHFSNPLAYRPTYSGEPGSLANPVAPAGSKAGLIVGFIGLAVLVLVAAAVALGVVLTKSKSAYKCGHSAVQPITPLIIGGDEARPHSWPWSVFIRIYNSTTSTAYAFCGGVLVANQWVITAAHCTSIAAKVEVLLGVHDTTVPAEVDVESTAIYTHPDYDYINLGNDIGAIKLPISVTYSSNVQPVCLPDSGVTVAPGNAYMVTGWGLTTPGGVVSQKLMQTQMPVVPDSQCINYTNFEAPSEICASWPQGGRSPCQGDSGGPLVMHQSDGAWVVVGLVSYTQICDAPGNPTVFTDVSVYRSWIDSLLQK